MNIKVLCHNQKISNINFSILEIFQSYMRRIRINIYQLENIIVVKEQNQKKVSIVNNVFLKSKTKHNKFDIDISDHPRIVTFSFQRSRES